jgi:predicted  nucleic acid-binding Zn-ribbon protein
MVTFAILGGAAACTVPTTDTVAGQVDDELVTVQAPTLRTPVVDPDAGFAPSQTSSQGEIQTAPAGTAPTGIVSLAAQMTALGTWNMIKAVGVRAGDTVTPGQTIARFDDASLRSGVAIARADAVVAAGQVPVLNTAIDDTYDKQHRIDDAITKIDDAIDQLSANRIRLAGQLSQARRQLPQLEAKRQQVAAQRRTLRTKLDQIDQQLSALRLKLAQLPPQLPDKPPLPARQRLAAAIRQLEGACAQLSTGLTTSSQVEGRLAAGIEALRAGIPRLETAISTLKTGLATARNRRAALHTARSKIIDARAELRRLRRLAVVAAEVARTGIDIARNELQLATVSAPVAGVVVDVVPVGQFLAPGATIATIREDADPTVTTWLAPDQLAGLCTRVAATVSGDWMSPGQQMKATVIRIGQRADYPPTAFATDEVHLTRAVPVTVAVSPAPEQPALPAGAPVDVRIHAASGDCPGGLTDGTAPTPIPSRPGARAGPVTP